MSNYMKEKETIFLLIQIDDEIKNFKINEIEKIFEESGAKWKDKERFLEKS